MSTRLQTILIAGSVDREGNLSKPCYTIPDNLPGFPDPPVTVSHPSTGFYELQFIGEVFDEFPGPVVNATVFGEEPFFGDRTDTRDNAIVVDRKRSYARIKTGDAQGNADDRGFFFTAVGTYEVGVSSPLLLIA